MQQKVKEFFSQLDFSWRSLRDFLIISLGALVQAWPCASFGAG